MPVPSLHETQFRGAAAWGSAPSQPSLPAHRSVSPRSPGTQEPGRWPGAAPPSPWLLTLLLHHKVEEERDALLRVAAGDLVLVPAQQSQQANVVTQNRGCGLFLRRGPVGKTALGPESACPGPHRSPAPV